MNHARHTVIFNGWHSFHIPSVLRGSWAGKMSLADALAIIIPADILAMAYRLAREREGALDQFNKGHLKP